MATYLAKRLLIMIPTLLGITALTFLVIRLAPGDPVTAKIGGDVGSGLAAGGGNAQANRERLIVDTKIRLGLMRKQGIVRVWGLESLEEEDAFSDGDETINDIAVSADGARLAEATSAGTIRLRDAKSGRVLATLQGHSKGVNSVAFSADGGTLASASDDLTARVWNVATGSSTLGETIAVCEGHERLVRAVACSPGGDLISTGSRDGLVRLWNAASGKLSASFTGHTQEVTAVVFSSDGRTLYSGSLDRVVNVWDISTRKRRNEIDCRSAIYSLALSRDDKLLAAGLANNAIAVHETDSLERFALLRGHTAIVSALAFAPDAAGAGAATLVSGSHDKSVGVWDVEAGERRAELIGHSNRVMAVAVAPSGVAANGVIYSTAQDVEDVPLVPAYINWLGRLSRLDFGRSIKTDTLVWDRIAEALPVTLELNILAFIVIYLCAIPIGLFSAARRGTFLDECTTVGVFLLYSMPSFWVGTLLIIIFGSPAGPFGGILPFVNLHDDEARTFPYLQYLGDHIAHLVLPLTALVYASFAFLSRLVRTSMLETLGQDYIRTARAKGLAESTVIGRHAFRNSLIPVVTVFGNLLPAMIGGSVIIERIFSLPGMGSLSFQAILERDYPVVMGITTLVAVLTMLGILLSDVFYCLVDPRIKLK